MKRLLLIIGLVVVGVSAYVAVIASNNKVAEDWKRQTESLRAELKQAKQDNEAAKAEASRNYRRAYEQAVVALPAHKALFDNVFYPKTPATTQASVTQTATTQSH